MQSNQINQFNVCFLFDLAAFPQFAIPWRRQPNAIRQIQKNKHELQNNFLIYNSNYMTIIYKYKFML